MRKSCEPEGTSHDAKWSAEADGVAAKRQSLINKELNALEGHAWAGSYYEGDGKGVNISLILAPTNGYLFEWHGCLGRYDRNYGSVAFEREHLRLSFAFPNRREGFQGISDAFLPVTWGDRRYLIPSDDIIGFCNDVNYGSEPRTGIWGHYLLRTGDEEKQVSGFPVLPPQYSTYLLKRTIEAKIIKVGSTTTRASVCEWNFIETTVELDSGKRCGILPGMRLHVVEPNLFKTVEIHTAEEFKSTGVVTQLEDLDLVIQPGWTVATGPRRNHQKRPSG